ncbi:MAG: hypothetical protein QMD43_04570 [Thermodesulfovibrio sp.]|uniref:hypothetical protein n=1 Tax=unclassified Thermodesulfovibrio TaxID=2645936 RepID=UPI00083A818D|nr:MULTISPECIES: hypothetical protein [unclassified Thermodesulfovibrio]MDI1472423.1 hypothetical protein [Thermodesulfovibrio sp. 1176]MDI6714288.1 hypothetical protein [Thermodesulfovibrio sp.]ODA44654.1 hypothetical protein THER_0605 [Thermodesulfovibrio sp. N1]
MKAIVEIEFKDLPVERIQQILIEMLSTLKTLEMIDEGKFQIFTPDGVVTEKCIFEENKVVA